jgi:hypothetical protein
MLKWAMVAELTQCSWSLTSIQIDCAAKVAANE